MVYSKSSHEFVEKNQSELQPFLTSVCLRYGVESLEDSLQDIYTHIIKNDLMSKYDSRRASLSTFLYKAAMNIIIGQKKSVYHRFKGKCVTISEDLTSDADTMDRAMSIYRMDVEQTNLIMQNMDSDSLEGPGFDLKMFRDTYLPKKDAFYTLNNRKNKAIKTGGCKLSQIYDYLFEGLTSKEIAKKYGISNMFVSIIKRDIAQRMEAFGLSSTPKRRRHRGGN